MPRPIILGVVGDSAAGKTTITRGLVRAARRRARHPHRRRRLPPLRPPPARRARDHAAAPRLQLPGHHGAGPRARARAGGPILKPVYRHKDGTFGAAGVRRAAPVHGRRGAARLPHARRCATSSTCASSSPRPRSCAATGRSQRDCSRRGYTTDQVLEELDRREPDSEAFIRPQQRWADIVVSFMPGDRGDQDHLDAELTLRDGLGHPDLAPLIDGDARGHAR